MITEKGAAIPRDLRFRMLTIYSRLGQDIEGGALEQSQDRREPHLRLLRHQDSRRARRVGLREGASGARPRHQYVA